MLMYVLLLSYIGALMAKTKLVKLINETTIKTTKYN